MRGRLASESARLRRSGYREDHFHSEGWIGAVYYVAVHDAVENDGCRWPCFGEHALPLCSRERELQRVQPMPGLLVLFPSASTTERDLVREIATARRSPST
jgi:hypothetical protein